jgi:hypothetical protein
MLSLRQWLAQGEEARTGIVTDVSATCNLSIFPRLDRAGNPTGEVSVQINFPAGDQSAYRLYGFLESTRPEQLTLGTIADLVSSAFGIHADAAVWETEDIT